MSAPPETPLHAAAAVASDRASLTGWLASLEQLFPIPAGYRKEDADWGTALDMLRCGEDILRTLVDHGLPCTESAGIVRFDRHDLFNLALYSGSGSSLPETAFSFALRWMGESADSWFEPKLWDVRFALVCARPDGCEEDPGFTLAMPTPEIFGGSVALDELTPTDAERSQDVIASRGTTLELSATIETRGQPLRLRSTRLRTLIDEFMAEGWRWTRMPEALQREVDDVLSHGAINCICGSLELERRCREAGFEARTRRGWLLGMFDFDHAWLEVEDEDGRTKVIDCVFPLLGAKVPHTRPEFGEACIGSPMNRVLPTGYTADEPLVHHTCGGAEASIANRVDIRRARQSQDKETVGWQ